MNTAIQPPLPEGRVTNLLSPIKELGTAFFPVAIGILYISGFLVLNSNLAKDGVLDVEFLNARYFLAGANFVFYLVCFYLFAGRAVLFTPKWLDEDLKRLNEDGGKPIWSLVVLVHAQIKAVFFGCLSAAMFTSIAIGTAESVVFYAALAGAFFVRYTFDVTNLDLRFPRISETVTILAELIAIYAFFKNAGAAGAMLTVFFSYVGIFMFINIVMDGFARYRISKDRIAFTGIYGIVFLLSTAITYGALFYGEVSSKLGGARPQTVSVGFSDEVRKALPPPFATATSQILEGKLIHQTSSYIYISTSGHTVRLRAADVVAVVSTPESDKNYWNEFLERNVAAPIASPIKGTASKPETNL